MKQSVGRVVLLISLNQASSFSWPALASSSSLDRIDRRYGYGSEIQDVTCFSTIIHNNGMSSSVLLYVSGRKDIDENDTKNTKRENYVDRGGKKHMKKSEIDDLVRGIGLRPVVKKRKSNSSSQIHHEKHLLHINDPSILNVEQTAPIISLQNQLDYSRYGHAALRSFLPEKLIQQLRTELIPYADSHSLSAWRQKVEVQLTDSTDEYYKENACTIADSLKSVQECQDLLESLGLDPLSGDLPFLQHFNTWRSSPSGSNDNKTPTVRKLCLSSYLAQSASILLNAPTIRLYQDSLFHKRVGDGWTPWHSDARMAPFDTSKMITFWVPLQNVPKPEKGGTGLQFVDGSHSDFALPYWNGVDGNEWDRLENRYDNDRVSHHMPLEIGDVTVHNGWTLHCADSTEYMEDGEDRYAFSITYVDGSAEVREDVLDASSKGDNEDVWSFRSWVKDIKPRTRFLHPQVPIVWPRDLANM